METFNGGFRRSVLLARIPDLPTRLSRRISGSLTVGVPDG
jgi:hypothetical protein